MSAVTNHDLSEIIAKQTLHIKDDKELAHSIAAYLLLERKTADLDPLMRDVMQYRIEHGVVEADVVSAHDLTTDIHSEIKQLIKLHYPASKEIILHEKHDAQVIGGVRVQLPSEQLDLSVANKLANFKRLTSEEALA